MGYTSYKFRKLPPARLEHRDGLRHPVLFGKVTVRRHAQRPLSALLTASLLRLDPVVCGHPPKRVYW